MLGVSIVSEKVLELLYEHQPSFIWDIVLIEIDYFCGKSDYLTSASFSIKPKCDVNLRSGCFISGADLTKFDSMFSLSFSLKAKKLIDDLLSKRTLFNPY